MTSMDTVGLHGILVRNGNKEPRGADPLPRLLAQLLDRAGGPATVERATSRPWASALFQGRRHVIILRLTGADAAERRDRFMLGLEEAEWTLPRHFVADITVDESRSAAEEEWLKLSALTIEDW
ncbi:MAG TPA: hypothetical protein VJM09_01940 [Sphingobium sp.]|nr:hypothetical protein [Sphingobium sp.]